MVLPLIGNGMPLLGNGRRAVKPLQAVRLHLERLEDRAVPAATDLGIATEFNAFIFDDYTASYTDAEGRVAVGDDADFTGYGIGFALPNSNGTRDDLIVGDDLKYLYGEVFKGNIVYGDVGDIVSVGLPNGTARQEAGVIDFAAAQAELAQKSLDWGTLIPPNAITDVQYGTIYLSGTDLNLNVFSVTSAQLASATGLAITAPAGSTVLVNVSGTDVSMSGFAIWINGTDRNHVLFNFFEATTLSLSAINFEGSILAPLAAVDFNNGQLNGVIVGNSLRGNGQLNLAPPDLNIVIPPPANSSFAGEVFQQEGRLRVGAAGLPVSLTGIDPFGNPLMGWNTTTQGDGSFQFDQLPAGTYEVVVDLTGTDFGVQFEEIGSVAATLGPPDGIISDIVIGINDPVFGFGFGLFQMGV